MQPEEIAWPIYSGWLVPWMRYSVSLLPLVEIHGARAHRVLRAGADEVGHVHALLDLGGRRPGRPFGLAADLGDARPGQRFIADGDAVADRLAAIQHVIEIARVGIDHDRSGQLLAVILDDVPPIRLGDRRVFIRRRRQQLLVARRQIGFRRRLDRGLHAPAQHETGAQQDRPQTPNRHDLPLSRSLLQRPASAKSCLRN